MTIFPIYSTSLLLILHLPAGSSRVLEPEGLEGRIRSKGSVDWSVTAQDQGREVDSYPRAPMIPSLRLV